MHMRHRDPLPTVIEGRIGTLACPLPLWGVKPPIPDDGRTRSTHDENLWSKSTEQLVYPAGAPVPDDELDALIRESDLQAFHRQGRHANGEPA